MAVEVAEVNRVCIGLARPELGAVVTADWFVTVSTVGLVSVFVMMLLQASLLG